jgi:hypothetical protein
MAETLGFCRGHDMEQEDPKLIDQLSLPGISCPPSRSARPALWRNELRRQATFFADIRARDQRHHDEAIGRLVGQIEDLRHRLLDLERQTGTADLRTPPRTRASLRAYAAAM